MYTEEVLFSIKKENTGTCFSTDKLQKHYCKWAKPDAKDYILHDSIYLKCQKKVSLESESWSMFA